MMYGLSRRGLNALLKAASPSLRGVAVAYIGLAGIVAGVLVLGVGLMPVGPVIEQATEPARQAVSSLVSPAGDALVGIFGGGSQARVVSAPRRLSPLLTLDVTISDAPLAVDESVVP